MSKFMIFFQEQYNSFPFPIIYFLSITFSIHVLFNSLPSLYISIFHLFPFHAISFSTHLLFNPRSLFIYNLFPAESPTQESHSVTYFPSDDKVKGDQLSSTSCMGPGRLAGINTTTRLVKIACYTLKNHSRHLFWTGLR